jgi:hypothetical protein
MAERKLTDADRVEVCRRYLAGESSIELSRAYNVSKPWVLRCLKQGGITRRSLSLSHRLYECNHQFFANISSETQAYWLGFLAADGSISHEAVTLALAAKDQDHILRFREALGSTHPLGGYQVTGGFSGRCGGTTVAVRLAINSPEMLVDLSRYGVVRRKTFTVHWPNLATDLLRHYLRGLFDGDGCFITHRKAIQFALLGNTSLMQGCQQFLMRSCQVAQTRLFPHTSDGIVHLRYCGRVQVRRIYDLLYEEATIYLPRKRAVADGFFSPD